MSKPWLMYLALGALGLVVCLHVQVVLGSDPPRPLTSGEMACITGGATNCLCAATIKCSSKSTCRKIGDNYETCTGAKYITHCIGKDQYICTYDTGTKIDCGAGHTVWSDPNCSTQTDSDTTACNDLSPVAAGSTPCSY